MLVYNVYAYTISYGQVSSEYYKTVETEAEAIKLVEYWNKEYQGKDASEYNYYKVSLSIPKLKDSLNSIKANLEDNGDINLGLYQVKELLKAIDSLNKGI